MRTIKWLVLVCVCVILVGCSDNQAEYDEVLADFYSTADTVHFLSHFVLASYSNTWSDAIDNQDNFSLAVAMKQGEYEGLISALDASVEKMSSNLKVLSEASKENSDEYGEIYEESKELFRTVSALMEQVHSPSGSLLTFNQNTNELSQDFSSKYDMIGALLSEEVKEILDKMEKEQEAEDWMDDEGI